MTSSLLVTGASGQLGGYLVRQLTREGASFSAWSGSRTGSLFGTPLVPVDLTDPVALADAFRLARPAVVLHAAALSRVADCHRDPPRARAVNVCATRHLAELCSAGGARLILVSTDLVFDGDNPPYRENASPSPVSVYGASKAEAEDAVLAHPGNAVVRLSLLFGPSLGGKASFFDEQVDALRAGRPLHLFEDEWRTPLSLESAAVGLLGVARSDVGGILHLGGPERLSRLEMGRKLVEVLGAEASLVVPISRTQAPAAEPRPRDLSLNSSRWRGLFPDLPWVGFSEALLGLRVAC